MARAKKKTKPKLQPADFLGMITNYITELIEAMDWNQEGQVIHREVDFADWLADEPDFLKIPSSAELQDNDDEEVVKNILRQKALMYLCRYFNAECMSELLVYTEKEGALLDFFDEESDETSTRAEWEKALDDFIEDEQYMFFTDDVMADQRADDWEAAEEQVALDEAIANNAISSVKENIESTEDIPEEEFAIGMAEENGLELPQIPADTDASVDSFIESITSEDHVHGPDCNHHIPAQSPVDDWAPVSTQEGVPGSYLLWKWEIKAVIEKHKKANEDEHPVKALANGAKELVESGAVTTKGGLLDALLELIEAEPADALTIVKCFEQLN
ncbi:MAG: hypothetical protein CMF52_06135 [Legionellales bacterium]|nr:hypothetical protein [Legionellales bacterium]